MIGRKIVSTADELVRGNLPRWSGKTRGHYEVWYFTGNAGEHGFWIRYTINVSENDFNDWAGVWCAVFKKGEKPVGICRKFPLSYFSWCVKNESEMKKGFEIRVGEGNYFTERSARGRITVGNLYAEWDINFEPSGYIFKHLPEPTYYIPVETALLSPNPDLKFSGYIRIRNIETGDVMKDMKLSPEISGGYQTHIWGKKHAYRWVWGHSNTLYDENGDVVEDSFFEGITVVAKIGPLQIPPMTVFALRYKGKIYEFNGIKDIILNDAKWKYSDNEVIWELKSKKMNFNLSMHTKKDNFIMATYDDPDGEHAFCHNSEVEDAEIVFEPEEGRKAKLYCKGTFHTEFGARTPLEYEPVKFIYE